MASALTAYNFFAQHAVGSIGICNHSVFCDRLKETGPACTGFIFCVGCKQCLVTSSTIIGALLMIFPVLASESPLSTFFAKHFILQGGEFFLPLRIRYGGEWCFLEFRFCFLGLCTACSCSYNNKDKKQFHFNHRRKY